MDTSNWKQRLGNIPVLGQLARALRGVYSLPIWRAQLRADIAQAQARHAELAESTAQALAQVNEPAMRRIDAVIQRLDEMAQRLHEPAERVDAVQQAVHERLAHYEQLRVRQAEAAADMEQRLHAMEADLLQALRGVRQLQLSRLTQAEVTAAEIVRPPAAPAPVALAEVSLHAAPLFAPYTHILTPLAAQTGALALHLHTRPPAAWLDDLAAHAGAGLSMISALAGAEDAGGAPLESLLEAALAALAPGGVLLLQLPNPENLMVAAELMTAEPPARSLLPARAERLVRQAGYAEVAIQRLDAEVPTAAEYAEAGEVLSRLLHGSRQYAIVARRGV